MQPYIHNSISLDNIIPIFVALYFNNNAKHKLKCLVGVG